MNEAFDSVPVGKIVLIASTPFSDPIELSIGRNKTDFVIAPSYFHATIMIRDDYAGATSRIVQSKEITSPMP